VWSASRIGQSRLILMTYRDRRDQIKWRRLQSRKVDEDYHVHKQPPAICGKERHAIVRLLLTSIVEGSSQLILSTIPAVVCCASE
jgi:hypothetical protein